MKVVNIAELRAHLGEYLEHVTRGGDVEICKRNQRVARIVPVARDQTINHTRLGSARGSVRILGDIVAPAMHEADWEMNR